MTSTLALLESMASLSTMPTDILKWLADEVVAAEYAKGDRLIVEGETTRDCHFIVSGETEVFFQGESLGLTGAGEPEGEMGLLSGRVRSGTTIVISERLDVLTLPARAYDDLCRADAGRAEAFKTGLLVYLDAARGITATDAATRSAHLSSNQDPPGST